MALLMILLVIMTLAAMWAVMARSLLKAAIGLAITSVMITILMFRLDSPLAAVFELSVCVGLITVVFISTISLTKPLTHKEIVELSKDRLKRFWYLPVIMILAGAGLMMLKLPNCIAAPKTLDTSNVQTLLWNQRQMDLFGQILIMLAGAIGVVILFVEEEKE